MLLKKRNLKIVCIVILFLATLTACQNSVSTEISALSSENVPSATAPQATQTALPTPTPTEALPLNGQESHYKLDLTVDYYNHFVSVDEEINYTNKSEDVLNDLVLVVSPMLFQDSFFLKNLTYGNDQVISVFYWEGHRLHIPLEAPLEPGGQVDIKISFSLVVPRREGTMGYTGKQLNLANWYPFIPPYKTGEGWQVHDMWLVNSFIVGEHLVYEVADFEVNLQFTDRRENMKIAASAGGIEQDGIIHYRLDLARGFAFSISDIYVISQVEQDGVTILSYAFPEHQTAGEAAGNVAADAIAFYGEIYSPYSRPVFSVIEADFLHGMEFDGMTLLSRGFYEFYDGTPLTNLTIITAHETSHQWFFSLIGNDQATEPWLDEALATYSEALFYEHYHPDNLQWWWDNRVYGYNPSGYVDSSIYFPDGYVPYRDSVYLRGVMFIQALRDAVGDEAFFAFIKDYVKTNSYGIATRQDFFATLTRHSDVDITPVLKEYFQNP